MRNTVSIQQTSGHINGGNQQRILGTVVLWLIQGLLALIFLFAGSMKLIMPIELLTAQMTVPFPGWFVQFIGVCEVLGALGLLLPGLLRMQRILTPLAAAGLLIIMIGATSITLLTMDAVSAMLPLVVGLLSVCVIYGRRSYLMR